MRKLWALFVVPPMQRISEGRGHGPKSVMWQGCVTVFRCDFSELCLKTDIYWNDQRELSRISNCKRWAFSIFAWERSLLSSIYLRLLPNPFVCAHVLSCLSSSSLKSSPEAASSISTTKQPYGSGDSEDGYTLAFNNLDEFQAWREAEEERNCVEFVKVWWFFCSRFLASHLVTHAYLLLGRYTRQQSRASPFQGAY